jgi:hypothetical protein
VMASFHLIAVENKAMSCLIAGRSPEARITSEMAIFTTVAQSLHAPLEGRPHFSAALTLGGMTRRWIASSESRELLFSDSV